MKRTREEQKEYCKTHARNDGYIYCWDCKNKTRCSIYIITMREEREFCDDFELEIKDTLRLLVQTMFMNPYDVFEYNGSLFRYNPDTNYIEYHRPKNQIHNKWYRCRGTFDMILKEIAI